jgi:hypothetical protein
VRSPDLKKKKKDYETFSYCVAGRFLYFHLFCHIEAMGT